ncbi:MAG: hypothetical protein E6G79_11715 [Alphaproteobacteria bacterium]|nr:MAG: hypothetical protein E6G79_11715 [Alphaproteobacteria bacterium]
MLFYRFEDHVLDTSRRELWRGEELLAVEPQVFDLLVFLISNRDRVVSKEDLINAVWSGRIVSDSTLASRINAVRRAIGDNGREQRLIRTGARRGFRFVAPIEETDKSRTPGFASQAVDQDRPVTPLDKPSIAVLPFTNLSGDPDQEYFVDGVVEEIITAISRVRWLFVIARNSSFTYKGKAVDVKRVARELGVRYVLEGSLRRSRDRVRITGQLIDTSTGAHIWADHIDSALDDIFELQDRVASSVVGAIEPKLRQSEIAKHGCLRSLSSRARTAPSDEKRELVGSDPCCSTSARYRPSLCASGGDLGLYPNRADNSGLGRTKRRGAACHNCAARATSRPIR